MKKIIVLACTFLPVAGFSQTEFALFAGPQMTTASYKAASIKQSTEPKYGFFAGAAWKVPFENKLSFAPEVFYSMKGYKVVFNRFIYPPGPEAKDNNTSIHCHELAGLLQLDLGTEPSHFFFKGGLSLDFQLYGKEKFNTTTGSTVDRKIKYDFGAYGRYSANSIFQLGYETSSGFFIAGRYSYGLANINNADEGPNIHHIVYGVSVGAYLKKNKIVIDTRNKE